MTVSTGESVIGVIEGKVLPENPVALKKSVMTWCSSEWRPILAEFISTAILVLMGCMANIPFEGQNSAMYGPLGFGLIVMFNIQIFGHISGAYMNPAVTLAAVIWGKTSITLAIVFLISQCAGGIAGYAILTTLSPMDLVPGGVCVTRPFSVLNDVQALGIEIVLTAALSFINCAIWDPVNENKQESAPIKFGLTIVGLSLVGGPWTGASMNPARSLAPAVFTGVWTVHWVYWVGPFVGSGVAAIIYKFIFLKKAMTNT